MVKGKFDEAILALYQRVQLKWAEHEQRLLNGKCGYSIFGSKPYQNPALVVLGMNPGFEESKDEEGPFLDTEPTTERYLECDPSRFKIGLRKLFAFDENILNEAVVANLLFFRSKALSGEGADVWEQVEPALRVELESYCRSEVEQFISLIRPKQILMIGLSNVWQEFTDPSVAMRAEISGRWKTLIVTGSMFGVPAIGLPHPSSPTMVSEAQVALIKPWLSHHLNA